MSSSGGYLGIPIDTKDLKSNGRQNNQPCYTICIIVIPYKTDTINKNIP
jgi:hypothetical protein